MKDQKNSERKNWNSCGSVADAGTCPKCGASVICEYREAGSADFLDVYTHECTDCSFSLYAEKFSVGMSSRSESKADNCPFCSRAVE